MSVVSLVLRCVWFLVDSLSLLWGVVVDVGELV